MLKNYLKTALRTLRRNKLFSLINILGLSIRISAAIVIYLIVQYDFSFEQFQKDKDSTYRVVTNMSFASSAFPNSGVPYPVIDAARKEVRGIEQSASFFNLSMAKVIVPRQEAAPFIVKHQSDLIYTDDHYFRLFTFYQWLAGTPASLAEPFRVTLSESRALTYFPGLKPSEIIGRTVIYDDSIRCTVTGIVKDIKDNTDLIFKE